MRENKLFKTLEEQIDILRAKGLTVEDIEDAKKVLLRENYFFLSGYRHLFFRSKNDKRFIEGTTFEELYAMFSFDRSLRNILFQYILIIENNIKSIISYQLSKKYGYKEKDYLDPKNFTQDNLKVRQVNDVLNKMRRQIRVNVNDHTATMHYAHNYGYIPMWILVKVLSFGLISELYCILKANDQFEISELYHVAPDELATYLSILANFRNLCAHEDILYDHRTKRIIENTIYHQRLEIPTDEDGYIYGKNDLFAVIIILKQMLTSEEFRTMMNEITYEIDYLEGKVDVIPIEAILHQIGFPKNFRDIMQD